MSAVRLIEELISAGVALRVQDGRLYANPVGRVTDEQKERARRHRDELVRLVSNPRQLARERLALLAARFRVPVDDLLHWYRDDLQEIAGMDSAALAWAVEDYARHRRWYRATFGGPDEVVRDTGAVLVSARQSDEGAEPECGAASCQPCQEQPQERLGRRSGEDERKPAERGNAAEIADTKKHP